MSGCKHERVFLVEAAEEIKSHYMVNGAYQWTDSQTGDILSRFSVKCLDCDWVRDYWRYGRMPKWVRALLDAVEAQS